MEEEGRRERRGETDRDKSWGFGPEFEILFLVGQDNLRFKKKNEFIIYIGSHGDYGAECADIILPGATYTEQDGYFTNLEGKIQKSYKASYPPGDSKEDWEHQLLESQQV